MSDPIHDRGKQMEDLFFKQKDEALLEKLRAEQDAKEQRQLLISVSGIADGEVIDALIEAGVSAESMTCISMIPLVAVAWADRKMDEGESEAILKAAESVGIDRGSDGFALLVSWLADAPEPSLLDSWKGYVAAVLEKIDETKAGQLKTSVMSRCEEVAKAAGGFLGFGNKISDAEQKVLDDLATVFG